MAKNCQLEQNNCYGYELFGYEIWTYGINDAEYITLHYIMFTDRLVTVEGKMLHFEGNYI